MFGFFGPWLSVKQEPAVIVLIFFFGWRTFGCVSYRNAPIPIPESGMGTDTGVEYSTRACKIHADTTTRISVVYVSIQQCVMASVSLLVSTKIQVILLIV